MKKEEKRKKRQTWLVSKVFFANASFQRMNTMACSEMIEVGKEVMLVEEMDVVYIVEKECSINERQKVTDIFQIGVWFQ